MFIIFEVESVFFKVECVFLEVEKCKLEISEVSSPDGFAREPSAGGKSLLCASDSFNFEKRFTNH